VGGESNDKSNNLRAGYQELCTSYRAIDDFRAKLLGFLPLATAGGIGILLNNLKGVENLNDGTKSLLATVGFFGALITFGLFLYELYGIRKCSALIQAGRRLEKALQLDDGQFERRPESIAGVINEPFAAGIIYPAVLAAWAFFAFFFAWPHANPWIPILVFIVGFACTFRYARRLKNDAKHPARS
jgi:hypothetical protein